MEVGPWIIDWATFSDLPTGLFIAVGAAFAGFLTTFVGLVSLIASKENKLSEFRHEWIEGLRVELVEFLSKSDFLIISRNTPHDPDVKEIRRDFSVRHKDVKTRLAVLRNWRMERIIDSVYNDVLSGNISYDEINKQHQKIIKLSKKMLKSEWNRLERGGIGFQISKVALQILGLSMIVIVFIFISESLKTEHIGKMTIRNKGVELLDKNAALRLEYKNGSNNPMRISLSYPMKDNIKLTDNNNKYYEFDRTSIYVPESNVDSSEWIFISPGRRIIIEYIFLIPYEDISGVNYSDLTPFDVSVCHHVLEIDVPSEIDGQYCLRF